MDRELQRFHSGRIFLAPLQFVTWGMKGEIEGGDEVSDGIHSSSAMIGEGQSRLPYLRVTAYACKHNGMRFLLS